MNGLIKTQTNEQGEILVSGRELHEFLEIGTEYAKWISRMFDYGFEENADYVIVNFDEKSFGRPQTNHALKINMAKEISMIQRSDKGKEARQYFLKIEEYWNSPEKTIERAMQFQKVKIEQLENKLLEAKPKLLFAEAVGQADNNISVSCLSKLIAQNGYSIGQKRLFSWLRENGYLILKPGNDYNTPKQQYIEQGLFRVKEGTNVTSNGTKITKTTMVTGKGQQYFINKFLKEVK